MTKTAATPGKSLKCTMNNTKGALIIEKPANFALKKIFECGQCFRWNKSEKNEYTGVAGGRALSITERETALEIRSDNMIGLPEFLGVYLDLDTDYKKIDEIIDTDSHLHECIEYGKGIRILRQDPFETMISFIISQNNNIPRIKAITERICEAFGNEIDFEGKTYYSFPSPERLKDVSREKFRELGLGFRDRYIVDAVTRVTESSLDLKALHDMDTESARNELMKVTGIGRKVADCILLFAYHRLEICPVDVWMKKIFMKYYDIEEKNMERAFALSLEKWGEYAGIAQQYLFYYEREESLK